MNSEVKVKKAKASNGAVILYIAALIVGIVGIALLVSNIALYSNNVASYVEQGYDIKLVNEQLIPGQLLPGIFEAVGMYGGLAFLLLGIGMIFKKVSEGVTLLSKSEEEPLEEVVPEVYTEDKDITENEPETLD